jgi:hypothetical protein|tara:strand:+ start:25 stop:396 length:372 start_codon:yes stop_codon:yes gene_type:complete
MTKQEFKEFCIENNLRYKKDACGDPISPSRKGLKTDQLYWTGDDELGVYAERLTQKKFTFLKKKLVEEYGLRLNQDGDTDSTFFATKEQALRVARLLGCAKNVVAQETRDKMSRLLKERLHND